MATRDDAKIKELDQIAQEHNGLLKPEDVVAFASNPDTALHGCFCWDDSEAAKQYRLHQARQLIRVTVRLIDTPKGVVRAKAYFSLTPDRAYGNGYRTSVAVMNSEEFRIQLLTDAKKELESFKRKYNELVELVDLMSEINKVLAA